MNTQQDSTYTDDVLEARLRAALQQNAEDIGTSKRTAAAVLTRASHATKKHRRLRIVVASMAACSLLLTGFGIWKVSDRRAALNSNNVAAENGVYPLRLKPTSLPQGSGKPYLTVGNPDAETVVMGGGPGYIALWTVEGGAVVADTYLGPAGSSRQDESFFAATEKWKNRQLGSDEPLQWSDTSAAGTTDVWLSSLGNVSDAQLLSVAKSLSVSVGGRIVIDETKIPSGFESKFSVRVSELRGNNTWEWSIGGPTTHTTVHAQVSTPNQRLLKGLQNRFEKKPAETVTVRGVEGTVSTSNAGTQSSVTLTWSEHGWDLSIYTKDKATALSVAEGLETVDKQNWEELTVTSRRASGIYRPTRADRELATSDRGFLNVDFGDEPQGQIAVRTAEIVTGKGCFNAEFTIDKRTVKQCIPITRDQVMWSQVETVAGKRIVIALVDESVDVVVGVSDDSAPPAAAISSLTVTDITVDNFFIDTDTGSRRVGFVVVPFNDSVSALDLYRSEPAASSDATDNNSVWPESVPVEGVETDDNGGDEFDSTLTPVGRYEINKK
jgi:hypothetical protein